MTILKYYLRNIHKRKEIDDFTYEDIRLKSTRAAGAYDLPKTQKSFDILQTFRPLDTTGTACQPGAKYLSRLLFPPEENRFTLKDSIDAFSRIYNIPKSLFYQGYSYVSCDVKSLFTNIYLKKVINIIVKRVYDEKLITTQFKKRTLKKLLIYCCNNELYQQVDGVSMGSPLGRRLENILMTAFENVMIVRSQINEVLHTICCSCDQTQRYPINSRRFQFISSTN